MEELLEETKRKEEIRKKKQENMAKARAARKVKKPSESLEEHMASKEISLQPVKKMEVKHKDQMPCETNEDVYFIPRPRDLADKKVYPKVKIRRFPVSKSGKKIRVRVKDLYNDPRRQVGDYDLQRMRAGDVFQLDHPMDFSDNWMEIVDESVPLTKTIVKGGKLEKSAMKKVYFERADELKEKVQATDLNVI